MKRKILWCWLSLLLVAALVLASCGPKEEVVVKKGEMYGGTLTWYGVGQHCPPDNWDVAEFEWKSFLVSAARFQTLLYGDIEKYGPRGTNEFAFESGYIPEAFVSGDIAERWEVSPDEIVFHIRHGIMWADSPIMESRELTADDVAHSLKRMLATARIKKPAVVAFIDDVLARDRYTVVVETNTFSASWAATIGYDRNTWIQPPELVEAGAADWRNHIDVGSGPFLLEDYVEDVSATFVRNPNYWGTTTIDGVEYAIPFVDRMVFPYIIDVATRIAALRTAKLDWMVAVPLVYEDTLRKTCPDLIFKKRPGTHTLGVWLRTDQEPLDDINVRRALMIGLDKETIVRSVYTEGTLHAYPVSAGAGPVYTPFDELPPSARELYEYDPEKARRLLADAGYPDGFEMELIFVPGVYPFDDVVASLIAQWDEIGVELTARGLESAAFFALINYPGEFKHSFTNEMPSASPWAALELVVSPETSPRWADEYALEQYLAATAELDVGKQAATLKELSVYVLEHLPVLPIGLMSAMDGYWPWLKNYYGEVFTGFAFNSQRIQSTLWIDQDLKKEMGY